MLPLRRPRGSRWISPGRCHRHLRWYPSWTRWWDRPSRGAAPVTWRGGWRALVGGGNQGELLDPLGERQGRRRPVGRVGGDGPGDDLPGLRVQGLGDDRRVRHDTAHGEERVCGGQLTVEPLAGQSVVQGGAEGEYVTRPRRAVAADQVRIDVPDVARGPHPGDG